jgi:hypothetical protein
MQEREGGAGVRRRLRRKEVKKTIGGGFMDVIGIEGRGEGTGKKPVGKKDMKMSTIGHKSGFYNPAASIAENIKDAMDPMKVPSRGRTLADMTQEEREAIRTKYGTVISGTGSDSIKEL